MEIKDHDAQYSFQVKSMGSMHVNMNAGSNASLKVDRSASPVGAKVVNSTSRTERRDMTESSQNTTNALSSSQKGKRF